jgi:hypothetical protein
MTLVAGCVRKQPGMVSRVGVTRNTSGGENSENSVGVAFGAGQASMRTCQREFRQRVVKRGWQPTLGGVTGAAAGSKLSFVGIIF